MDIPTRVTLKNTLLQDSYLEQIMNIIYLFNTHEISNQGMTTFEHDQWDLSVLSSSTKSLRKSKQSAYFHSLQDWAKSFCKAFIASRIFKNYSTSIVIHDSQYLNSFFEFVFIYRTDIMNIFQLDKTLIEGYIQYLIDSDKSKNTKYRSYNHLFNFFEWLKKTFKDQFSSLSIPRNPFKLKFEAPKTLIDEEEKAIPLDVCQQMMKAIKLEEEYLEDLWESKKQIYGKGKYWYRKTFTIRKNLLLCQVIKLLMATGRRISHICDLHMDPLLEGRDGDAEGVWLVWNETKTKQGDQKVFVPEPLATVVRETIKKSIEITEPYRNNANNELRQLLFLTDFGKEISSLSQYTVRDYLNGQYDNKEAAFVFRYNIRNNGELYHIKPHGFRHTRATQLALGNAGLGTIQHDLAHMSEVMTLQYINSDEVVKKELTEYHNKGELFGKALPLFVNEEDAPIRIKETYSEEELTLWEEQGAFFHPNKYGYCILPVEGGPCPTGDPCWIGCESDKDDGCRYLMYTPSILIPMEEDVKILQARLNMALRDRPYSPIVGHYKAIIRRYETIKSEIENKVQGIMG